MKRLLQAGVTTHLPTLGKAVLLLLANTIFFIPPAQAAVTFGQQNARNFPSTASGTIAFTTNTLAGSLVVVGLYFGPGASVTSVTDNQGNPYTQIGTPLSSPSGKQSAALYYARNIAGGPHSVTATLSAVPAYPGMAVFIFEYRGVNQTSPLDGSAQARGTTSSVSSGAFTTTAPGDLLFGFCISDSSCSKGSGFTARSTFESNLGEDKTAGNAGSYSVTATATAAWTIHAAAFKASTGDTIPPSIPANLSGTVASPVRINLSWSASTDNVGVSGYRVFRNGSQIAQVTTTSYADTGLTPATTYSYTVAAYDAAGNVSAQSAPISRTTQADTTAPSVPNALMGSVISPVQINLSWNASTDNVAVAGYRVFRNGSQVAQIATTSYSDTGLSPSTTYSYRVAAYDAAGNVSAQSSALSRTTPADTAAPSVPTNLTASAVSSSQINLSWTASTDNAAVAGYRVFRNGSQIAQVAATSYSNSGLTPATTYSYTVAAYDAAGNVSAQTTPVPATTLPDTTAPSIPANLMASAISMSQINLSWSASTDNVAVTGYRVFRDGTQIAQTGGTSYSDTNAAPGPTYSYTVAAYDAAGNVSPQSSPVSATTQPDTTPPSVPANVTATAVSSSRINVSWNASLDNVGVTGYRVFRDGSQIAETASTSYLDTGLDESTAYSYAVAAFDAAGNASTPSSPVSQTTLGPDTTPPSVPTGLNAAAVSSYQISLSWTASSDDAGVTGYKVYRDGSHIATTAQLTYPDVNLVPGTSYSYTVAAFDAAGNTSSQSASASAQTPDTIPPTIALSSPLANSTVSGAITVSADASDNIGVSGVQFLVDGVNLGAEDTSTPYSVPWDSTTVTNGVHSLSARARDAAGNQTTATAVSITVDNPILTADPFSIDPAPALKFGTHEVVLTGNGGVANPFDTIATVTFTPPSGASNAKTVRAFYDGANTWRARVYVTEAGNWQWASASASDPGLNGASGSFPAIGSTMPGLLKRDAINPRAFRSDNGRWFAPVSDTAWLLFNRDPIVTQNWQQFVQDDAARGINVLGPVGSLESWGTGDVAHQGNNEPWLGSGPDYTRYDLAKFQNAESRVIWIFRNYPGLYIQSMLLGTQVQAGWGTLPSSVRSNTLDYMIARWSAFPNLFWLVSEDQEMSQPATLAFNREVGNYVTSHEPWRHLMSTQPNRDQGFPFTTPADLNWVDYINIQVSDPLGATQAQQFSSVPRHVMMGESYYEQDWGTAPSNIANPGFYYRWSMWSWLLSGGSSNYGGRYGVLHAYTQTWRTDLVWIGPGGTNFSGHQLHGLDSTTYIWPYFESRGIDLSLFQPNDNLVTAWAMRAGDVWRPKLMQRGNQEFLVYDPLAYSEGQWADLDTQQSASMTINLTAAPGTFQVEWYRPLDGVALSAGTIQGGAPRILTAPWLGHDVVLRLTLAP